MRWTRGVCGKAALLASIAMLCAAGGCEGTVDGSVSIRSIEPDEGTAAGGERVLIRGSGLTADVRIFFGDRPAAAVEVVEAGSLLAATTPVAVSGTVDVRAEAPGGAADRLEAAFRFDALAIAYADYTPAFLPDALNSRGSALADLDGDGDLDWVVAVRNAPNRLLLGDGAGHFVEGEGLPQTLETGDIDIPTAPLAEDTIDVAAADLDADGALDLYFANWSGQADRLYLGNGDGTFVDASAILPPAEISTHGVAIGDIDGDGDLDLVIGEQGPDRVLRSRLAEDGLLVLEEVPGALPGHEDNTVSLELGDVDLDGDLDLVVANHDEAGTVRLYLNDGSGIFSDAAAGQVPATAAACRDVLIADLDGDGAPDLLALTVEQDRLYVNDGHGFFFDDTLRAMPYDMAYSSAGTLFDADLDGDLDVVIAMYGATNRLYLNDGDGVLRDRTVLLPADLDHTIHIAAGDLDGDGDADLLISNDMGEQDKLYLLDAPRSDT